MPNKIALTGLIVNSKRLSAEIAKLLSKTVVKYILYAGLLFMSFFSVFALMFFLGLIFIDVKETVRMAFTDPEDINYVRRTDGELYVFFANSCLTALVFSIISFNIFMYLAILYWFYYAIFIAMFSKVWKFHGKSRRIFFSVIIATITLSLISAPFIRAGIKAILNI